MNPDIFPILATVIAFGVLSVAACALCNTIGVMVHAAKPNEDGDLEYVYALDRAHEFREELRRFPSFQLSVFILAAIVVVVIAPRRECQEHLPLGDRAASVWIHSSGRRANLHEKPENVRGTSEHSGRKKSE